MTGKPTAHTLKKKVCQTIETRRQEIIALSRFIHAHPEIGFHEVKAAAELTRLLKKEGFDVERGICGMKTAFRATYGSGRPAIALLAEYDALPQLGHACGHNVIAAIAAGAALASRSTVDALGGSVVVFGTPAEELFGGKAIMVERGAFRNIDAALIVHPGRRDAATERTLACISLDVEFFGREAHAAAHPELGVNALEAMLLSFNAINSLRQHISRDARIHGIITDGGKAANVVPAHTAGSFLVRSPDRAGLAELQARVLSCFQAAAQATGTTFEHRWGEQAFDCLKANHVLSDLFGGNMAALGRPVDEPSASWGMGSTDMGNVSQTVPAIHPSIRIASRDVTLHSPEFARAAASEEGDQGALDGAKAMAMTVVDLLARPGLLKATWNEFEGKEGVAVRSRI